MSSDTHERRADFCCPTFTGPLQQRLGSSHKSNVGSPEQCSRPFGESCSRSGLSFCENKRRGVLKLPWPVGQSQTETHPNPVVQQQDAGLNGTGSVTRRVASSHQRYGRGAATSYTLTLPGATGGLERWLLGWGLIYEGRRVVCAALASAHRKEGSLDSLIHLSWDVRAAWMAEGGRVEEKRKLDGLSSTSGIVERSNLCSG